MYWQKRFNENNPDEEIEGLIKKIFEEHKGNYGYRRIGTELRNRGYMVNSKKILRIMRKLNLKCIKFTRKSRKRSEEHTSELQSRGHLVCGLLLETQKQPTTAR